MAVKKFKPRTPSSRYRTVSTFEEITRSKPEKSLLRPLKSSGGRNMGGRVTARHRGGGHKRRYRVIDFKRDKIGVPKRYILAAEGLRVGDTVASGSGADIRVGNAIPLREIPLGTDIHNIELKKGKGGQLVRGAGTAAQLVAREGGFGHVRLPSGEVRLIHLDCLATIGQVGNVDHESIVAGKAGRSRWLGRRPRVRGVATNPHDHPMGGGEGRSSGGRHPCTPWGRPTKGYKTRGKKLSDKYIVRRRK